MCHYVAQVIMFCKDYHVGRVPLDARSRSSTGKCLTCSMGSLTQRQQTLLYGCVEFSVILCSIILLGEALPQPGSIEVKHVTSGFCFKTPLKHCLALCNNHLISGFHMRTNHTCCTDQKVNGAAFVHKGRCPISGSKTEIEQQHQMAHGHTVSHPSLSLLTKPKT